MCFLRIRTGSAAVKAVLEFTPGFERPLRVRGTVRGSGESGGRRGPAAAKQQKLATAMIRSSDNAATNALWKDIGGTKG
ncbi:serine hydrolase, partial [Streptomyces niveus]